VVYDSTDSEAFIAHLPDGRVWNFVKSENGLYYYDTSDDTNFSNLQVTNYGFLATVEDNEKQYHRREVESAKKGGQVYALLNRPGRSVFERILSSNQLSNCPVTVEDAKRFFKIYGADVATLRGKTVKKKSPRASSCFPSSLPPDLLVNHRDVTLCGDIFFVQGIPFLHTISRKIKFRTASRLSSRSKSDILTGFQEVFTLYKNRGFNIKELKADNEFKCLKKDIGSIHFDPIATDDHVSIIERSIRTIKDDLRTLTNGLPFKRIPRAMVTAMVTFAIRCCNLFPVPDGVSTALSPLNILTGAPPADYNHMSLEFGTYVHIFNDNTPSNTMASRTTPAIALNSVVNSKGDYYFLNLETGKRVTRHQWTALTMTKSVIQQVNYLGLREKQPLLKQQCLLFERRPGVPVSDDVLEAEVFDTIANGEDGDDDDFVPPPSQRDVALIYDDEVDPDEIDNLGPITNTYDDFSADDDDNTEYTSDDDSVEEEREDSSDDEFEAGGDDNTAIFSIVTTDDTHDDADDFSFNGNHSDNKYPLVEDERGMTSEEEGADDDNDISYETIDECIEEIVEAQQVDEDPVFDESSDESSVDDENREEEPTPTPAHTHHHNLRNRTELNQRPSFNEQFDNPASNKSYAPHLQFFQKSVSGMIEDPQHFHDHLCDLYEHVVDYTFNQMTAREGIEKHGEDAVLALFKEFAQLHDKKVFKAVRASDLSREQKRNALRAINLIKEKRNGDLKGRTCADGRKQRNWYTKERTTSPTISNDSLMAILTLSAAERRKIAMWDVEGAYLLADQDDYVLLKFTGESVDVLCKVDKGYEAFVTIENGKRVLYLELLKALSGCLKSALLWYELYSTKLKGMGYVLNPYDTCVANKDINGKQCTIGFYVDDNIATHVEDAVLTDLIGVVEEEIGAIKVSRGNKHTFLGMDITFNDDGTVTVDMKNYVTETIRDFPDKIRKKAASPAKVELHWIDSRSKLLNKERREKFHSVVMKLMFVCQRCRLDITTAISFLCTRVSQPTEQDWIKLMRVLEFLNGTVEDCLTLGADSLEELLSFVDVSFAVHPDMKSHTGGGASFGRGIIMSQSKKQKINTASSTESEVVGVSDYLPNTIWLMKFLGAQGYEMKRSTLYQDNESAIKLITNGKKSGSRRTRHFDIRYFNIKDRLKINNIDVVYCPTESMVADFFTKPLQGALFRKLRRVVMGMDPISILEIRKEKLSPPEERVGTSPKAGPNSGGKTLRSDRSYADVVREKI
jgi:hypothetical protein